ncbi:TonB-dependent receptor [Stakelama sediminis]|uniref:Vitamin B12 transporter n=1 Tax=Stakelama sediminis TaxID=463200 RepID=A0A840Z0C5_9SPHN|nr:TonB-dependent receptor [Stakelama sediminis]MBB5719343.1 vitamin B12 transporter [Stakelama sediminis]
MLKTLVSISALTAAVPALAHTTPANDDAGEILVTASRSGDAQQVADIPASITVIDAAQLQERQTRIVSDVLRDVPGIAVNRTGGVGGFTQIRLRGTESNQTLVLIDGIEADDPFYGEYDFGTLLADPDMRIEVLRGQQSSLYGSDAIGGVVQIVTLTGAEAPGVTVRAEGGSQGTASVAARVAGVTGNLDYALSATGYRTDGYPTAVGGTRNVGSSLGGANAKLIWTPSDTLTLTAVGRYSYTDADTNNTDSDPTSPTFGYTIDTPGQYYTNQGFYGLVKAELSSLGGRWTNALSAQIADTDRRNFSDGALSSGDHGTRYKGSFVSSIRFGDDHIHHQLTAAVDAEREEFRNTVAGPYAFGGKRHVDNLGLVAQYQFNMDDALALGASVRHDLNSDFADDTTYRVQGGYRFATGTRIHAAWGTGVKEPGFYELYGYVDGRYIGNPGLKPEKSTGWEVGVDQQLAGGKGRIGATFFKSVLTDEIITSYLPPDYLATSVNADSRTHQKGVEVFAGVQPIDLLRIDLAYTWLDATDDAGQEAVRRPRNIGSINVTAFSPDKRFSGTLTVRYNGRMDDLAYTDPSYVPVRVSLQSYALLNFAVNYKLTDHLSLYGRVENLLGERYQEIFSTAGSPRAGYAGVRATF